MTWSLLAVFFFGQRAFRMAVFKESPLMRWAAQSAEISLRAVVLLEQQQRIGKRGRHAIPGQ
jgi:hypothetical protein